MGVKSVFSELNVSLMLEILITAAQPMFNDFKVADLVEHKKWNGISLLLR